MRNSLRALGQFMAPWRWHYAGATLSLVISSCFLYLAPVVTHIVIDGALASPLEQASDTEPTLPVRLGVPLLGGPEFVRTHLWIPGLLILILTTLSGLFTYLRARLSARASEGIIKNLRDRLCDHLHHLPCTFYDHRETGDLIQRCTSDVETLRLFLSTQIVEFGRALVMLVIPIPLMMLIDGRMTVASLILVPPIVFFSGFYFMRVRSAFQDTDEAEGRLTSRIQENLTGIRVVKAFGRQDYEEELFDHRNREYRELDYHLYRLFAWFWSFSDLLCYGQKAIVVGTGVVLMARGQLAVGAFFFFLSAVVLFTWPVRMMGRLLSELGKALVAVDRLQEILQAPQETNPNPWITPQLKGRIKFDSVGFSHGQGLPVLHEVSFEIAAGSTVAILGPSGSGKSTLVNLLLRFYDPNEGRIYLDDYPLDDLPRPHVRSQLSVVMQEPFLYSRSLRENLSMARHGLSDEELELVTKIAAIHDSIQRFDRGYDTVVGERGVTLSGGQRQRVALARALVQKPAILILDDALSAVDTDTETAILDALRQRKGHHTTLIIAHRLSTLQQADEILVLDKGRVTQRGSHHELLTRPGLYQRLWELNTKDACPGAA